MADKTILHVSVDGPRGQLIVHGPLVLWRELLAATFAEPARPTPTQPPPTAPQPAGEADRG